MSPEVVLESSLMMAGCVAALVVALQLRSRQRVSVGGMARGVAVGILGAAPATLLVLPLIGIGIGAADSLQAGRDVLFLASIVAWLALALLGTAGLWLASVRPPAATTFMLVACGLVANAIVIADGLLTDPTWFLPRAFDQDAVQLLMLLAPFVTGAAYVASALRKRRAPRGALAAAMAAMTPARGVEVVAGA